MSNNKKQEARRRADRLRDEYERLGTPLLWFEALYKEAEGDAGYIPWGLQEGGHQAARRPLLAWLERLEAGSPRGKALDVGCGLGDNAAALQEAGFETTAFDISETAISWASERFAGHGIEFIAADLFDLPDDWAGRYDLVAETFTIQALKGDMRFKALKKLAVLVKPGGRFLIVCRGRLEDEDCTPPPWPLTPSELQQVETLGFEAKPLESFFNKKEPPQRMFLAEFIRSLPSDDEAEGL